MNLVFKPHVSPRGLGDTCLCTMVFIVQALFLFVLPGSAMYLITSSMPYAVIIVILIYITFTLFSVSSATLTDEGIHFKRLLGFPKFLPWNQITNIAVAPRMELIVHGWLWPLFPAREMTPSLSSLNHYRISWDKGYCYYPPTDILGFEQAVQQKLKPSCTRAQSP